MLLIAFRGLPGTGKTLGRELSRILGWPMIDKDDIKDILDGEAPHAGRLSYTAMLNLVRRQLHQGLNVICVSTLTFQSVYEQLEQIANETGARLVVLDCICPDDDILRQRIESRAERNLPAHHQTEWNRFAAYRETYLRDAAYPVTVPWLRVETTQSLERNVQEVIRWLSTVTREQLGATDPMGQGNREARFSPA